MLFIMVSEENNMESILVNRVNCAYFFTVTFTVFISPFCAYT